MTYELSMNQNIEEVKKRKIIALKSSIMEELKSDSFEDSENKDEMAMIIRRFKRFMKRKKFFLKKMIYKRGRKTRERKRKGKRERATS